MYLCMLPVAIFLYTITHEKKKAYLITAICMTAVFLIGMSIARFAFGIDLAIKAMIWCYILYLTAIVILIIVMLISDGKYCKNNNIKEKPELFFLGASSLIICIIADVLVYLSGVRSVTGYTTFTRIGAYVFYFSMGVDIILDWARENASLREFGFTDVLTGVGNRRSCLMFENDIKGTYPYGYVMCDVNALKLTNDTYGHKRGDELIMAVANRLVEVFGQKNVFRVGGDEFIAFSFEPTLEGFNAAVDRARGLLSTRDVSASLGGAYAPDTSCNDIEIRRKAENNMYAHKEQYYTNHNDRRR